MAELKCKFFLGFLLCALFNTRAQANTITASSCSSSDVQTAINSASERRYRRHSVGELHLVIAGHGYS